MKKPVWIIIGASSIIAQEIAHLAAKSGYSLLLVGRSESTLNILTQDLKLRYGITCSYLICDLAISIEPLLHYLQHNPQEYALCLAASRILENQSVNTETIAHLIHTNITSLIQIIHAYWHRPQMTHQILFLSSVAACRGRAKNSLYGGSKAAVEIYLQGLQQNATPSQQITYANLGFIDTKQTFGISPFPAASPEACAKALWNAVLRRKRQIYYPFFWKYIMQVMKYLPFGIYKRLSHY